MGTREAIEAECAWRADQAQPLGEKLGVGTVDRPMRADKWKSKEARVLAGQVANNMFRRDDAMAKLKSITAKVVIGKIIVTARGGQVECGKLKFKSADNDRLLRWVMAGEKLSVSIDGVESVTSISKLTIDVDGAELKNPWFKFGADQYGRLIKLVQSGAEIDIVIEQVDGELPLGDLNEKKDEEDILGEDEDEVERLEGVKPVRGVVGKGWERLSQIDHPASQPGDEGDKEGGMAGEPGKGKRAGRKAKSSILNLPSPAALRSRRPREEDKEGEMTGEPGKGKRAGRKAKKTE